MNRSPGIPLTDRERGELLEMYKGAVEEIRITKKQAWTYTNYLITMNVAGLFYVRDFLKGEVTNNIVLAFVVTAGALLAYALHLINNTANRNARNRTLLVDIGDTMEGIFKTLNEPSDRDKYVLPAYDREVTVPLAIVCISATALFVGYLFSRLC